MKQQLVMLIASIAIACGNANAENSKSGVLDPKATSIDVANGAQGQSAPAILDALKRLNTGKSQYESDAVYGKRMKALIGEKVLDGISVGDVIGFQPISVSFRYDANKEQWNYEVSSSGVHYEYHYVPVYRESLDAANYPLWVNQFPGKRIEFQKSIYLDIASLKGLSYINGFVKTPAKDARALEGSLAVLLVGRLTSPYFGANQKLPVGLDETVFDFQSTIGFKLEAVWLINKKSGQILSKAWTYRRLA